jgi:3',5'-cyclic AMP phosphodiesterase CpdA
VLLPATGRAGSDVDPNRFILMADTHVCADRNAREHDCNPDETIQQAVKDILELTPRPAAVIIAGDCVYLHGLKPDYEALKEFLGPLREAGIPLLLAMGNHDNRASFESVFPDAAILHGAELKNRKVAVVESPHADWYLLDSCKMTGFTGGELGEEQLSWLGERLNKTPDKPALLVAHHYPKNAADDNGLGDTEAFLNVIGPRRQVKGYIFGHSHAWSLKQREDGLHFVNLPANAWLFKEENPRGFVDAQLEEKGCVLTLHCLDRADKRHGEKHELAWRSA